MKSTCGVGLIVARDLRERGIFALHLDGDLRNRTGVWSTVAGVARPPSGVFSSRRLERGGVQWRMRRAPRALCCHGGDCEAACEWLGSGVFHPVGWSVLLQRLRGEGSCMALVRCCPLPQFSVSFGSRLRFRRLHECEMWVDAAVVFVLCGFRRCPNPISLSCFCFFSFSGYDLPRT